MIERQTFELPPVPSADHVAILLNRAVILGMMPGEAAERRYDPADVNGTVDVAMTVDEELSVTHTEPDGTVTLFTAGPSKGLGYEKKDAEGTVVEAWAKPIDETLEGRETLYVDYPIRLLVSCELQGEA